MSSGTFNFQRNLHWKLCTKNIYICFFLIRSLWNALTACSLKLEKSLPSLEIHATLAVKLCADKMMANNHVGSNHDGDKQSNQIHVNFQASIHELHMGTTRTDSSHSAQLLQCLILESSIVIKYFKIFDETSISTVGIIKLSMC